MYLLFADDVIQADRAKASIDHKLEKLGRTLELNEQDAWVQFCKVRSRDNSKIWQSNSPKSDFCFLVFPKRELDSCASHKIEVVGML